MKHTILARLFLGLMALIANAVLGGPPAIEWRFSKAGQWHNWQPNSQIKSVRFEPDSVRFDSGGQDPAITSPAFDWPRATNQQHVELDLDASSAGSGELYFTNDVDGPDGGLKAEWFVPVSVPRPGRQVVTVWPFWEKLGSVARLRFDPPSAIHCRLFSIRVVCEEPSRGNSITWKPMHAARVEPNADGLRVRALAPIAMIVAALTPFDASQRSILRLDLDCPGEHSICVYWASRENTGLCGEPVELPATGAVLTVDLGQFAEYRGTITHLAIGFGSRGGEVLALRSFTLEAPDTTTRVERNAPVQTRTTPVPLIRAGEYEVPTPRPVATDYQLGAYYYPGWSQASMHSWELQRSLPQRDPLLGWYEQASPQVADWHIKWAVENGLSFFIYDWYYIKGREHRGEAVRDGLLKARYRSLMKFALMWANHSPANHTQAQLLEVADYWLKHYLREPNYLRVDDAPYVSFYSPLELLTGLGSVEKVRTALSAMRQRVREAGLPGLHIAAVDIAGQVEPATLKSMGFDSWTAYTYIRTVPAPVKHTLYRPYVLGFERKWQEAQRDASLPYVPTLAVGWDGPVWYGLNSERRLGRRTQDLSEALGLLRQFLDKTGRRMAILEAWNEWGEGAYLEPNVEFGFGDLEAIRRHFARPGDWPVNIGPQDVGLAGHYDLRNQATTSAAAP